MFVKGGLWKCLSSEAYLLTDSLDLTLFWRRHETEAQELTHQWSVWRWTTTGQIVNRHRSEVTSKLFIVNSFTHVWGGRILYLQILPFLPLKPTKVNVGDISVGLLISAHAAPAPSDYRHNTSGLSWSQAGVLVLRIKGFRPKYELLVKKATLESKRQDKILNWWVI